MKVSLRNDKGFSLVELMVVVAIIGILAAIAIPNFQRFTAKSKQAEAKADLSALFTAERSFQQEWQMYVSGFRTVGYQPSGNYRYEHGFSGDNAIVLPVNYAGAPRDAANINTAAYCTAAGMPSICAVNQTPIAPAAVAAAVTANTTFLALANADISGGANPLQDAWTLDQNKTLLNTVNGLP